MAARKRRCQRFTIDQGRGKTGGLYVQDGCGRWPLLADPIVATNVADADVIRGLDDCCFLYATSMQFGGTGPEHVAPIRRSTDLANWTYVTDAFTTPPAWAGLSQGIWAPDVPRLERAV